MKRIFIFLMSIPALLVSCNYRSVRGSGVISSQERHINYASKIKLMGSYNVEITQGPTTSVKVEADDNLLPYIITDEESGFLVIKSRDHVNFSSEHDIKVYITTSKLELVNLAGSGNITGTNKFIGGNKLTLKIAGTGDIKMEVNTPDIEADIAGSGSITLKGETKDQKISISGVGNYYADELKSESTKVKIAGSGDVKVFADLNLDISIAGMGSVYYKGAASIKQHIAGSGEIKKIE